MQLYIKETVIRLSWDFSSLASDSNKTKIINKNKVFLYLNSPTLIPLHK